MIYAIIENGKVVNTIVADAEFIDLIDDIAVDITGMNVSIGHFYENGEFKAPEPYIINETETL